MQFGDLATRIARAFRVTGRIPIDLDEVLVPVALAERLDQDPFRQEPSTWMGTGVGFPTPPAGESAIQGVRCVSGIVCIDGFVVNTGLMTTAFLNRQQTQAFATFDDILVELNQRGIFATPQRPAAVYVADEGLAVPGANAVRIGEWNLTKVQFGVEFRDAPVVLYPNDEFLIGWGADSQAASVTFWGREYPIQL